MKADAQATSGMRKPLKARRPHGMQGGTSEEANRLAMVILEVLAGGRTPSEAAAVLAVSVPRYYQLETRALEGLVAALEPRPAGKTPSPERRLAQLERELQAARRQCARQAALVRAAQRSLGIKPATDSAGQTAKDRAGRRRRRPAVRALKAAAALGKNLSAALPEAVQPSAQPVGAAIPLAAKDEAPRGGAIQRPEGATR